MSVATTTSHLLFASSEIGYFCRVFEVQNFTVFSESQNLPEIGWDGKWMWMGMYAMHLCIGTYSLARAPLGGGAISSPPSHFPAISSKPMQVSSPNLQYPLSQHFYTLC